MGKRDYRHHEPKKQKKSAKKSILTDILQAPVNVEVIRKKKREPEEET
jgi:hypothetical protein